MSELSWLTARPIAHRGLHDLNKTCWENTLSAFERAAARGYAIECDVHLSADGDVVVFHDNSLDRLTGTNGYIWQRTAGELAALRIGGTADHVPTLGELLRLVDGRVPLVIELKGIPGHDDGLVAKVGEALRHYNGKVAIMSFDHWLIRDFTRHAPGIPGGLTAWGDVDHELEAHFSMLAHGISFVSYSVTHLPNRFVSFVREKLAMPVITWTVRDEEAVRTTFSRADQMTFEGFEPDAASVA
ncbi:glycerophosphodiester phosphodiesterase [Aminobacter sp. P9b]|uniref:Glycerophosphoryl diester phosphodiesterase n=1 Tax=Aminobacter niigataensis TaxID=83265 RepID=A0ABR6KX65_9HYPH|nr:glycerophosphodiester phosphodiesterase [Aminobacter niigataensis]MBB4649113.1 glycerophosphoryl diester phosphodiesterase [Aminobacter niigataensis]